MRNNFRKSLVSIALVASVIVLIFTTSCNKYDKIPVVGRWECDIKELRGLDVDSCKEFLQFNSGVDYTYVQDFIERKPGKLDKWQVKGNFERKNNKLTFVNRVKDGTQPQAEITYKYELVKDETLTLYVKGEGYTDDKKIYKKVQ